MTRRFHLQRNQDVTGVSGTGVVADGVEFPDGTVVLRWRGDHQSTVVWSDVDTAMKVHGHGGATELVWVDDPESKPDGPDEDRPPAVMDRRVARVLGFPEDRWTTPVSVRMDVARMLTQRGMNFGPSLVSEVLELSEAILTGTLRDGSVTL